MDAAGASSSGRHFPLYIDADDEEHASLPAYYDAEELQIQEAILLSLDAPRAPAPAPTASSSSSSFRHARTIGPREPGPEATSDGKGKRKLTPEEAGGPGGSAKRQKPGRFTCGICMERVPVSEKFRVNQCGHGFCIGCVGKYIAAKVGENVALIGCPQPGCQGEGFFEMEMCRDIIPEELFSRWSIAMCESALGEEKYYCPFKDCSALLIDDSQEKITNSECPHCHRMFCAQCRVPWHNGISCEDFQKLGKDKRGIDDLVFKKLAKKKKWQRCPKCKMYVERIDGCLLMKCRCKHYFCYRCASPMSQTLHYCKKCGH